MSEDGTQEEVEGGPIFALHHTFNFQTPSPSVSSILSGSSSTYTGQQYIDSLGRGAEGDEVMQQGLLEATRARAALDASLEEEVHGFLEDVESSAERDVSLEEVDGLMEAFRTRAGRLEEKARQRSVGRVVERVVAREGEREGARAATTPRRRSGEPSRAARAAAVFRLAMGPTTSRRSVGTGYIADPLEQCRSVGTFGGSVGSVGGSSGSPPQTPMVPSTRTNNSPRSPNYQRNTYIDIWGRAGLARQGGWGAHEEDGDREEGDEGREYEDEDEEEDEQEEEVEEDEEVYEEMSLTMEEQEEEETTEEEGDDEEEKEDEEEVADAEEVDEELVVTVLGMGMGMRMMMRMRGVRMHGEVRSAGRGGGTRHVIGDFVDYKHGNGSWYR